MKRKRILIGKIPSILWGTPSDRLYLYVHGQHGCKEEAEAFAEIAANYGWQVLSIDLPEHGERGAETNCFDPWHVVPELAEVMIAAKRRWKTISLRANSIGAWFSMLAFEKERLESCLFVSPILDMQRLIANMMRWADVSRERLEQEQMINTNFGHTLSWKYLLYAERHPIAAWAFPTRILFGENEPLTERSTAEEFVCRFHCEMTVMPNGEHWFHTPEQLEFLKQWTHISFTCIRAEHRD